MMRNLELSYRMPGLVYVYLCYAWVTVQRILEFCITSTDPTNRQYTFQLL